MPAQAGPCIWPMPGPDRPDFKTQPNSSLGRVSPIYIFDVGPCFGLIFLGRARADKKIQPIYSYGIII